MPVEPVPGLGSTQLRDANEAPQVQVTSFIQPELRPIRASIARIRDFAQPDAISIELFIRDDGQPALRPPVHIRGDWISWPAFDAELAAEDELELPVQVNGKLRARIRVAASASEEEIRTRALAEEKVVQHLGGLRVVKVIIVPQKLVSIVAK